MTRRTFASLAAAMVLKGAPPPSKMGIATTCYLSYWKPKDTLEFLDHCHALGAAGIQSAITSDPATVRARAEQYGMYVEAMLTLPKSADTSQFEKAVVDAKAAGAACARTGVLSGRRYETFSTMAEWQAYVARTNASLDAALPILEKHKLVLGMENHKDFTLEEMVPLMKRRSSEYLGVCLDFGNNISLLDDPMAVVTQLAPYVVTTHVKDMGVEAYDQGFLLSEVPLGEGYLDLEAMIGVVRKAKPKARFVLEMITRDPLKVPCLTDKYWVTFPERNGRYLAGTLNRVQKERSRIQALPRVDDQSQPAKLRLEDENVKICLNHAREKFGL